MSATFHPALMPSFFGSGVPEYPPELETGTTGLAGGPEMVTRSAGFTFAHVVYTASGSSDLTRSSFSPSPPTKTSGTCRVAFDCRSAMATARPCYGRRERSMT